MREGYWGYYIYGRDSVNVFDMGVWGIKRVIKGVIILDWGEGVCCDR